MRLNWICGVLFATALTVPASAQIGVYIGSTPPRLRYEERGPMPRGRLRLDRRLLGPEWATL